MTFYTWIKIYKYFDRSRKKIQFGTVGNLKKVLQLELWTTGLLISTVTCVRNRVSCAIPWSSFPYVVRRIQSITSSLEYYIYYSYQRLFLQDNTSVLIGYYISTFLRTIVDNSYRTLYNNSSVLSRGGSSILANWCDSFIQTTAPLKGPGAFTQGRTYHIPVYSTLPRSNTPYSGIFDPTKVEYAMIFRPRTISVHSSFFIPFKPYFN